MLKRWIVATLLIIGILTFGVGIAMSIGPTTDIAPIQGIVTDEASQPVAGAIVRIQTTAYATQTQSDGHFVLDVPSEGPFNLTACAVGYYCGGPVEATASDTHVELVLIAHHTNDNTEYEWLPSERHTSVDEDQGCSACHSAEGTELSFSLPVDEWRLDIHSQTTTNPRFLTMYLGTDIDGSRSPLTQFAYIRDYGRIPLSPDLTQPYYGPGYKLDFPDTFGNCAACHTPAAAINSPYTIDPTQLESVEAEGIPCDFCHKVWDVRLNGETNLPFQNMPGVLSLEFRRPPDGHQFFAGPFDDVAPGEDTFSALQTQSQFCAACHYGIFWDTLIYNSFGEWLDSPYSDSETGQTCQDCHMPPVGVTHFAIPEQGGLERDSSTIFSHRMPGASDEILLQNTAELQLEAEQQGNLIFVTAEVTNTRAGHHIPTDSPLRQIFLTVTVTDGDGNLLPLQSGPALPNWAGDLEAVPGVYFAKILQELWTEATPSGAYWMPTRVIEDTRLPALATNTSVYVFALPESGEAVVEAQLIFRRAYYDLMEQKGWAVPDIVMEQAQISLP